MKINKTTPMSEVERIVSSKHAELGFEFCVFVAGWRHALRSEWPFIIIIITFDFTHGYGFIYFHNFLGAHVRFA